MKSWIWPARGRVEDTFGRGAADGRPGNKGIDIVGNYGEAIRAAAAGRVVYAGSGLPGYGELIIIKHNNDYLSAYAHNAQIDAKEGAMVQQGQIIAHMGDSGTDRVGLDFEIRKRGVPVNPIRYLPRIHHSYK
ncbi:MAG TPA: peptidoglycan DD-metalloendopeptidase family protein [Acidiferrobacter sp.]|nr:peptidoglycan DD-metalloendopeptidase family protein [Acidiferrobacter sp.]